MQEEHLSQNYYTVYYLYSELHNIEEIMGVFYMGIIGVAVYMRELYIISFL